MKAKDYALLGVSCTCLAGIAVLQRLKPRQGRMSRLLGWRGR